MESAPVWFYGEPVKIRVGARWVDAGTQPAVANGQVRLLLTDPDADTPCWDFDVEKVIPGPTKGLRFFGGEQVEIELLSASVAREADRVEEEVVEAAPTIRPIVPLPPTRPARRCPGCGRELEPDVIGLICACGAKLSPELARELQFAVVLRNDWETLAEFQRRRILGAFSLAKRGRKLTRQIHFEDRYATILVAESPEASTAADVEVLMRVFEELEEGTGKPVGSVVTDGYELTGLWKMLRERHGETRVWRKDEEQQ